MERLIELMNKYGTDNEPFLFIIDFDMQKPEIHRLSELPSGIKFSAPLLSSHPALTPAVQFYLKKTPVSFERYSDAFANVQKNITAGNTYLLNLTFPTLIKLDQTLEEIYNSSVANYKLLYHNKFVVFSPEIFVRIHDGIIKSFPMKGTIDASIKDAEKILLSDKKEEAEHNTIVDLIRNDLSKIADEVTVTKFRYIDKIKSASSELLQVSSEITGNLSDGYINHLGDIISAMLPAGSVTGAPKKETVMIIKETEGYQRGWYTGIFGVFDGKSLDSGVMIRFIEKDGNDYYFKSGGGITYMSDPIREYEELISKVYVPVG